MDERSGGDRNELAVARGGDGASALSVVEMRQQVNLIQNLMKEVMREGEHYGVIPGTNSKPCLLKPGAEKLGFTFRLAPRFDMDVVDLGNGHRECRVKCSLVSISSGAFIGEGVGTCSTMESKYRWRGGSRVCPECGKPAIKRSKFPPREDPSAPPGYYCFAKVGGCGFNFAHDDRAITDQSDERQENPDIADVWNTVLKMAKKRAHVDAILTATAASDIFTQDVDESLPPDGPRPSQPARQSQQPGRPQPPRQPQPPSRPAGPQMPRDGQELMSMFKRREEQLIADGLPVNVNELSYFVEQAGYQAGYRNSPAYYTGEQIAFAIEKAKQFVAFVKEKAQGQAAQTSPQDEPPPAQNGQEGGDEGEQRPDPAELIGAADERHLQNLMKVAKKTWSDCTRGLRIPGSAGIRDLTYGQFWSLCKKLESIPQTQSA